MTFLIVAITLIWGLAVSWQCAALLMLIENERYSRGRISNEQNYRRKKGPFAEIIIPCKGAEPGLRENLLPFFQQDYNRYGLTFVVN